MIWIPTVVLRQPAAALLLQAEAVAWPEVVTAIGIAVLALVAVGLAAMSLATLRSIQGLLRSIDRTIEGLAPRAQPVLDGVARITEDASHVTAALRQDLDGVHETLTQLNDQMRAALHSAEERVREFGAVLDIVQDQAQQLMLDATATARGVQATAQALTRPRRRRGRRSRRGRLAEPGAGIDD